jgi:hypothetical protein
LVRGLKETIDEVQRYIRGKPTTEQEVVERMTSAIERIQRIEEVVNLEIPDDVWQVIAPPENSGDEQDQTVGEQIQERIEVRTVKVQGPVTGTGLGPIQPLPERSTGVSEETTEVKIRESTTIEKKTRTIQTEVTYQFWRKHPRYDRRAWLRLESTTTTTIKQISIQSKRD